MNGLGRKPKTGAQAKQGQRRAGIVRHQDATTGAQIKAGSTEPVYEKYALKMLGIKRLKSEG